jgi:site-specific recombinase XerC
LRIGEIEGLQLQDYDRETDELRVKGKGQKERLVLC